MRAVVIVAIVIVCVAGALGFYLFRPLGETPSPAVVECYDIGQGAYVPLGVPANAFGVGLSYAGHIEETASRFDPNASPPVFEKRPSALVRHGDGVRYPTPEELIQAADALEPGLGPVLRESQPRMSPLLDYEVEMGFVLLEDIDPSRLEDSRFAPRLAFFIANDLSARSIGILGEGRANEPAYWGESKSFPGFMPVADRAWAPEEALPNGIPCVEIESIVNGEVRQHQGTDDLIYTPVQMLRFVHAKFPNVPLDKGLMVLTGTPAGVAMTTPRWLARLGSLLRPSRFQKLSTKLEGDTSRFLQVGDTVTVRGQGLGKVTVTIMD